MDHDESGVAESEAVVAEAPLVEPTWSEVLEDHVDSGRQAPDQVPPRRVSEIDGHRALVAGDRRPEQALAMVGGSPAAHGVALAWGLYFDDLGAVVAE